MEIFVFRHGEIVYPLDNQGNKLMYPSNTPLSRDGKKGIAEMARRIKQRGALIEVVYTSPMTRALQTAEIVAAEMDTQDIRPEPKFTDSYIPGWIGVPLYIQEELMRKGQDIYTNPRSPDQEVYESIAARMVTGMRQVIQSGNQIAAIVSHGDPIRLLIYRLLEHSTDPIPNMSQLSQYNYLKRGEVWRLICEDNTILSSEFIARETSEDAGQREVSQDSTKVV